MGRKEFFLALAEEHRDEAVKVVARVVDGVMSSGKPPKRDGEPWEFFLAMARDNPTHARLSFLCEKHALTWQEIDKAIDGKSRIIRVR